MINNVNHIKASAPIHRHLLWNSDYGENVFLKVTCIIGIVVAVVKYINSSYLLYRWMSGLTMQ